MQKNLGKFGFHAIMSHQKTFGGVLMKLTRLALLTVMVVMLAFSSAQAGFYAGFQIGPNFPMSSGGNITFFNRNFDTGNLSFATGIMLGAQVGYDFLGENTNFPAWAKYITLALDYQYNSYNINEKNVYINYGNFAGRATIGGAGGSQNALTFLFIGKLPLMESQDYPNGRLFPYIGLGPSIVWTQIGDSSSNNVGIVVEPGIRFMFTPQISGDLAYRFRYCEPNFSGLDNFQVNFNSSNSTIVLRVNYHF
jgi:opacity protein-like surface antigen